MADDTELRDDCAKIMLSAILHDPDWRREMFADAAHYRDFLWAPLLAERAYMMADAMTERRKVKNG